MKNWKAVCLTSVVIIACVVGLALKPVGNKTYHVVQVLRKDNNGPELEKVLNAAAKDGWELAHVHTEENKVTALIMVK